MQKYSVVGTEMKTLLASLALLAATAAHAADEREKAFARCLTRGIETGVFNREQNSDRLVILYLPQCMLLEDYRFRLPKNFGEGVPTPKDQDKGDKQAMALLTKAIMRVENYIRD